MSNLRSLLASAAALLILTGAPAHAAAPAWPQETSDVPAEPLAHFGRLPNGMRYVLMHNTTPTGAVSIRLRIGSGSLEETDAQRGLAHFLEHMAFKGSTHVPEGEMVKLLQRHGLAFGPDTNAFTNFDETVYQLDLPKNDDETLDLGLMLMRETASELTLSAKALEPERGVVLSEERLRDTPAYEASKARQDFLMKGQRAPRRWPIGEVEVIKTAPVEQLRAYYEANYRPERATLVIVGDIDPAAVEAKIKARFGDWIGKGAPIVEPDLGTVARRGLEARVIAKPGLTTSISVAWTKPHDASPETRAKDMREYVESVALAVVNRRLERLARSENAPFFSAGVSQYDSLRSIKAANLVVTPKDEHWETALQVAEGVRRDVLEHGITPAELAYEITQTRTRLKSAAGDASTRRSNVLAQAIVATVNSDDVFTAPMENLRMFEAAVKDLTPETATARLREIFSGNGPLLTLMTPTPYAPGEAGVIAGFKAAEAAPLTASSAEAVKPWPYTDFGPPGEVVDRREVADLGVTFVTFKNGVRLSFKHTEFQKNGVEVGFYIPGGTASLPSDRPTAAWASGVIPQNGLGKLTRDEIDQALAGKVYSVGASLTDRNFVLSGRTDKRDLPTELQVLTAYLSDPAWRTAPLARFQAGLELALDQIKTSPEAVLGRELGFRLHGGDQRWRTPEKAEVKAVTVDDVRRLWEGPLAHGPVDVIIVGDVTVDQAIDGVARTVAALPAREPRTIDGPVPGVHYAAPTATPVKLTHQGRADKAIAFIGWPTTDYYANPEEARATSITAQVLSNRLLDRVRIAEGATYSPSASANNSVWFKGYGSISASVETPPDKIAGFYQAVADISADLRAKAPTADELERAKNPRIEQIEKARQTNDYWYGVLPGLIDYPERIDNIRQSIEGFRRITAEDVNAVARKYLRDDTAFRIEVVAEGKP